MFEIEIFIHLTVRKHKNILILNWIVWNRTVLCIKIDLAFNNLQRLKCHKTKLNRTVRPPTKSIGYSYLFFFRKVSILSVFKFLNLERFFFSLKILILIMLIDLTSELFVRWTCSALYRSPSDCYLIEGLFLTEMYTWNIISPCFVNICPLILSQNILIIYHLIIPISFLGSYVNGVYF